MTLAAGIPTVYPVNELNFSAAMQCILYYIYRTAIDITFRCWPLDLVKTNHYRPNDIMRSHNSRILCKSLKIAASSFAISPVLHSHRNLLLLSRIFLLSFLNGCLNWSNLYPYLDSFTIPAVAISLARSSIVYLCYFYRIIAYNLPLTRFFIVATLPGSLSSSAKPGCNGVGHLPNVVQTKP